MPGGLRVRYRLVPGASHLCGHSLPDGSEHREQSMLTYAELESIDDDIDAYLVDAGRPSRPRGYLPTLHPSAVAPPSKPVSVKSPASHRAVASVRVSTAKP
ncbi:DUF5956 family protein [Arthrobacter sp. ISL-72]|uniref:DUF5956 family protein n=1 Tax=Arthrobacter sp. ISL-72 TaxID=2819114 RepID=UPI002556727A|nr:DUF5956 family protein [Arthrobacter sp. ISL-72]